MFCKGSIEFFDVVFPKFLVFCRVFGGIHGFLVFYRMFYRVPIVSLGLAEPLRS